MKRLVVEGWKHVNHSFAMVNQNQLLEWAQVPGLQLFHQEAPPFLPHWSPAALDSGFDAPCRQTLDALPPPDGEPVDCIFRIAAPLQAPTNRNCRNVTFMVTEFGLSDKSFVQPTPELSLFTQDGNCIVTPSRWSRDRLLDHGFDERRVHVVPHGVRRTIYRPMSADDRAARRSALGYAHGQVVFLNVGVATWNKGIDLLVTAFATVRKKHDHARLILKDSQGLYGLSVHQILRSIMEQRPGLIDQAVLESIAVISTNLSQTQLRELYCIADCYVSPYRAEGFNLPVLEAMACGTRTLVTAGGATDDFVCSVLAERIPATPGRPNPQVPGKYIEPELDALIARMEATAIAAERPRPDNSLIAGFAERMSWKAAADQLLGLCL